MDKPKVLFTLTEPAKAPPAKEAPASSVPSSTPHPQTTRPKSLFAEMPKAAPPVMGAPAIVSFPGMFVRKRPDMTVAVLRSSNSDVTDDAVFLAALEEILHSDVEKLTVEAALEFGISEQKIFALASEQMLAVSMDPTLAEIVTLLRGIAADVRQTANSGNGFHRFMEALVPSEKESEVTRLDRVTNASRTVSQKMDHLPQLRLKTAKFVKDLETCLFSIQGRLVVGRWLLVTTTKKEISSVIDGRLQSLTVTRLSLLQARQQIKVVDDRIVHLITVVNTSLVNMVPAWYGCCVAALENKTPSPTNLREKILEVLDSVK